MKYRKRPVVIEAVEFRDSTVGLTELSDLGLDPVRVDYAKPERPELIIETLEGTMRAQVGDYIIRGIAGEFYPCNSKIFVATYESVTE